MSDNKDVMDEVCEGVSELSVLSFRKLDDMKKLAKHFRQVIDHPITQQNQVVQRYLRNLDETHRKIFLKKRDGVEVEYIFTTEKKSNLQRQRFNSLPVSEVPELLKSEFSISENAKQVHICTDCNVEIELNDDLPLMESLQNHFSLEVHLPKIKRESIDVAEPIVLPKMSRRLSAMEVGENAGQHLELMQMANSVEQLDKMFLGKLETALIKLMPDKSEASIDEAMKLYRQYYEVLCQQINTVDFSTMTSSVAPLIMSIKDNVNQNFAVDANKNFENDEADPAPERPLKNQMKKYRYYGPIENLITKLLTDHKLLTLADDRTGKLAFFCISCEYYTLRFRYDSVLNHVFSDTHIHNLSCIVQADKTISFDRQGSPMEKIKDMNYKFLNEHDITREANGLNCGLCKTFIESKENVIVHILDENHLRRLSDKMYRKIRSDTDGFIPDEWGSRSLDWAKFLASVGKPLNNYDHVVIENFIRPSGKIANYCTCCDVTLKGPRQVLFNHIRQKKHLRNAAPHKLAMLYRNYCRPAEYYASFGNFYLCSICPAPTTYPSFAAMLEHIDSVEHVETIAKLLCSVSSPDLSDKLWVANCVDLTKNMDCLLCEDNFADVKEVVKHVLSSVSHHDSLAKFKTLAHRGDVIETYMRGWYISQSDESSFNCGPCGGVFKSIRALLIHLAYADHFTERPSAENFFRFYLELKHNVAMLTRNKYVYYDRRKLRCGVCKSDINIGENAKSHVVSPRHRENMGASFLNVESESNNAIPLQ